MAPTEKTDNVFATPLPPGDFVFNDAVADVFADMVHRSIPGYASIITQIGAFARRFVQAGSNIYDLGSSLGAATFAVRHAVGLDSCRIIAIDNSAAMVLRLKQALARDVAIIPVEARLDNVLSTEIQSASLVILNFTLQFIDTDQKEILMRRVFDGLLPGGALVLSEKITFANDHEARQMESLYYDFKRHNGYNELEISQKRDALENVLKLNTREQHLLRLHGLGFSQVQQWFQCLNFASFLAIR